MATGSGISDIHDAVDDEGAWAALPATAARLVGARSSVILEFGAGGALVGSRASYLSADVLADLARCHPDGRDVWVETGLRHAEVGRALVIDDVMPEADFLGSPLWNDVFRTNGDDTGRSMGLVHRLGQGSLLVTFQRAFGANRFGPGEARRLEAIATDLHRVHRLRALLGERDGRIARLEALLAAEPARVLLVAGDLELREASPAAQALLDRADGLALRRGRVAALDRATTEALALAVRATVRREAVARAVFLCRRPGERPAWRLLVLPAPSGIGEGCLLLVGGGEQQPDRLRLWLRQQHGATGAEAGVAAALLAGETPAEIAERRRVSLHTVRAQIRHLLAKTGARRLGELLVMLARLG